jgi:amino acid adenylation domain-containing protein
VESIAYKDQLEGVISCEIRICNLDDPFYREEDGYDLILANQSLHRCKNLPLALENIRRLLKENGCFIFAELLKPADIAWISTVFLKKQYEDLRKDSLQMLLSLDEWKRLIRESQFNELTFATDFEQNIGCFVLRNEKAHLVTDDKTNLKKLLSDKIPDYMIPKYYIFLQEFPITANGKVDHKALEKMHPAVAESIGHQESWNETEKRLADLWTGILNVSPGITDNFFMLGGDSLLATSLRNKICETFDIDLPFEMIYKAAVLSEMAEVIDSVKQSTKTQEKLILIKDDQPYEPFKLTDIQQSYLIGRSGDYELGNVSSHCYFEMNVGPIETTRMEESLNQVIAIHPMLRAIICEDNIHQRVLEHTDYYYIDQKDLSGLSEHQKEACLMQEREEMGHQTFDPHIWPAYDFRYRKLDEKSGRILISFDNIFFDGWSMFYIFRQWKMLYTQKDVELKKADTTFKEYVLSCAATDAENDDVIKRDTEYWKQKLPEIYPAPDLNVRGNTKNDSFVRYQTRLDATKWNALTDQIRSMGITAPAFLMSLYAEVLASFSRKKQFSLNITRFKRIPFSEDVNDIVGDFTALTILSLDRSAGESFLERTRLLQTQLWSDISHDHIDGVEVERMLNRGQANGITMPVVFTSGIGLTEDRTIDDNSYLGEIGYGLSQTPQVWMDMQVYDDKNGLSVSIDALKDIFYDGMLDDFWKSYCELLENCVNDESFWTIKTGNLTQLSNESLILSLNNTKRYIPKTTLLNGFFENVRKYPDNVAICYKDSRMNYQEVFVLAYNVAQKLIDSGFKPKEPVGILMPKGPEQIIAAIGIMMAGGIYLPLNTKHPIGRNGKIISSSGTQFLICGESGSEYEKYGTCIFYDEILKDNVKVKDVEAVIENLPDISPKDIAYIIYTSGTTGDPKGVAISHEAAMNTIADINEILRVNKNDAAICLSQMNFDLSVYDIFGMLGAGAKMVIPQEEHILDPSYWDKLIRKQEVTIWNSVPSYMVMYLSYMEGVAKTNPSLRAILLSGDWIPVDIKERGEKVLINAAFYGLGGATECSIWSNIHRIEREDCHRNSIPYGRPLANQRMYILNDDLESVRNNVVGNLYISGDGLAQGYWKSEERTRQSFIIHPKTGERMYKTGDLAMYSDEGFIVFIGRDDGQVKLNGYRIETGEVESAIKRLEKDSLPVVIIKDNQLHAFIDKKVDENKLLNALKEELPEYMIPTYIHVVDEIPLSANGKINRKYLGSICENESHDKSNIPLSTEWEKRVSSLWQGVLGVKNIYANDSFFKLGGDSLKAVIFVNELKNKYFIDLPLKKVLEKPTVLDIAKEIDELDIGFEEGEL